MARATMAPVAVLGAREDGEPLLVHAWSRLPIRTAATPPRRPLAPPQPPRGAALSILYRAPKKTSADQIRLNGSRGERIACGGGAQKQTYPGPTIAFHRALLPAAGSKIVPQNRKPFNMSARAFAGECEGRLGLTSPAPPPPCAAIARFNRLRRTYHVTVQAAGPLSAAAMARRSTDGPPATPARRSPRRATPLLRS